MLEKILSVYGLNPNEITVTPFGDGLINHTWKVSGNTRSYIFQKVNTSVFKLPQAIDENVNSIKTYLSGKFPNYLFISPIKATTGGSLYQDNGDYYRLFPFAEGSHSLNYLENEDEAYEAARQFGKFSKLLSGFNTKQLNITIPDFHNLSLRYEQFVAACSGASDERLKHGADYINFLIRHKDIVDTYISISQNPQIPLRVIHHDTKINNVLFDDHKKGLCVIDLDTVMPGYFISDVGDMMRTYLSEASEEETDLSKIKIRKEFYQAIFNGYMKEMNEVLTDAEKQYFTYSGKFIIYMQAIRFLTDYLENDKYYGAKYEEHNLNRAINQITLLKEYLKLEDEL
ncbi:MAG TPA: aminoglycoside phosphotransferase family protein [Pedobacter sp.]|uniref:phosphotransferase enzyme family protein n=1 Tax=Pedobacter sp. TaxID=1411316 RepID=UPI002BE696BD|nr:aminoglycoside phosphotransferase family protein [Pedobacter sp.]HMI04675.1 aminoglycoside phosphotransferase family protein [Pedobacter sp.]